MMIKLIPYALLPIMIVVIGCSGNPQETVVSPEISDTTDSLPISEMSESTNHNLQGIYTAIFDVENMTVEVVANRDLEAHFNVRPMIPPPGIVVQGWDDENSVIDVDVTVHNPHSITAFDVRVIIYTNPIGHMLMNACSWTALHDIPGGLPVNPFKAYAKSVAGRAFIGPVSHTENLKIKLPDGNTNVDFAIDASFPSNCEEPYEINAFEQQTLYDSQDHSAEISVKVFSHQNDVNMVQLYCPRITDQTTIDLNQVDSDTWSGTLENAAGVPAGEYIGFILATTAGSGSLCLYDRVVITVSEAGEMPVNPRIVGQLGYLKKCDKAYVHSDYLFSVDFNEHVTIFDISQLPRLTIVSEIHEEHVSDIAFKDNLAFMACGAQGLKIFDLQDITSPVIIYEHGNIMGGHYAINENILYCSTYDDLKIYDITSLENPIEIPHSLEFYSIRKMVIYNHYLAAFVEHYAGSFLAFIDISDPYNICEAGKFDPGRYFYFDLKDNIACIGYSGYINKLSFYDITDINDFNLLSEITVEKIKDVYIKDSYALVLSAGMYIGDNALTIVDISDPEHPEIIGRVDLSDPLKITTGMNYVFVSEGEKGLSFIDTHNPSDPVLNYTYRFTGIQNVVVKEDIAWLVAPEDGTIILDISDKTTPVIVNMIKSFSSNNTTGIELSGNLAYIIELRKIRIVDVSDLYNPIDISHLDLDAIAWNAKERDGYLYIPITNSEFKIADVRDPYNPSYIGTLHLYYSPNNVVVDGNYAYVSIYDTAVALNVVDISNPQNPVSVGFAFVTSGRGIDKKDNYVYLAHNSSPFHAMRYLDIIDVANPEQPTPVVKVDTDHCPVDVIVQGNYAYLAGYEATGGGGLEIIDISDPLNPIWFGKLTTGGVPSRLYVENEYVYMACIRDGFQIIQLWD